MGLAFTKIIKAGQRQREFNFTRVKGNEFSYTVDVNDDKSNRITFKIAKDESGSLAITESNTELPSWVWDASPQLIDAIQENFPVK